MKKFLIGLVSAYQKHVSPFFPKTCRYKPTCSHYAIESIRSHGAFLGTYYAITRILRCHQLHPGGWDPVKE